MESSNRYIQEWLSRSDPHTGAALTFGIIHQAAHDGRLFTAGYTFPAVANAGTARYALTTGAKQPNFNFSIHAGGENPTTRVGGGLASGELLLGTARNYMLDVVNVSGGNAVVSVVFEWYEESA